MTTARETLRATTVEVLETGLFVFLADGGEVPREGVSFRMDIRGSRPAVVGLRASDGAARILAAQMLGCDEGEVTASERALAAAEALNILAGVLVARTLGPVPELELCPPQPGGDPEGDVVTFSTDGGPVTLWYAESAA